MENLRRTIQPNKVRLTWWLWFRKAVLFDGVSPAVTDLKEAGVVLISWLIVLCSGLNLLISSGLSGFVWNNQISWAGLDFVVDGGSSGLV